ncbi:glycerol-3-phosphate 1-O-acyltransferase PlsY [Candidatus Acetothermia bacterium]|nr:glycerol-3-phosphate 1-O-acyltransferase PlsY [Candidatus Acetothermia bacterium]MBI3643155.1 glycerol-3-phosphate 1-O-acyltransferase PlsY [Candidatus Acetothermia bacterium]
MSGLVEAVLFSILNYLIGSIPFSYLIAKAKGVDPRLVGSGNVGATNVARSVGPQFGIAALLLDIAKGFGAAILTTNFSQPIWISGFAVAGHNWSLFLGFKSGKGVATTLGILLAISWPAFLITIAFWGVLALITRYVSIASVIALLAAPIAIGLLDGISTAVWLMAVLGILSVIQHKENFSRVRHGTEGKI